MSIPTENYRLPTGEQQCGTRRGASWECLLLIALVALAATVLGRHLLPVIAELLADGIESAT